MGAFNAVSDDLIQIARKMQDVSKTLIQINDFSDEIHQLNKELDKQKQDIEYQKNGDKRYYRKYSKNTDIIGVCGIALAVVFLIPLYLSVYSAFFMFDYKINIIVCSIMIAIPLIVFIYGKITARKKGDADISRINLEIEEKEEVIKQKEKKIEKILSNEFTETLNIIPKNYRYPFAIDKLAEYIENGRAESMKEAVNLFEEEKHRWHVEEMQKQQAERVAAIQGYARKTATASTISAGADAIDLISRLF